MQEPVHESKGNPIAMKFRGLLKNLDVLLTGVQNRKKL